MAKIQNPTKVITGVNTRCNIVNLFNSQVSHE